MWWLEGVVARSWALIGTCVLAGCSVEEHPGWQGSGATTSAGQTDSGEGSSGSSASSSGTEETSLGTSSSTGMDSGASSSGGATGGTVGSGSSTGGDPVHVVFTTAMTMDAAFGGFPAADAICQDAATQGGLGGTFVAILGDGGTTVKERVAVTGLVANTAGAEVASGADAFWNGMLTASVAFDEVGTPVSGQAWTGADAGGGGSANDCMTWTSTASLGAIGIVDALGPSWLRMGTDSCEMPAHLYCISQ